MTHIKCNKCNGYGCNCYPINQSNKTMVVPLAGRSAFEAFKSYNPTYPHSEKYWLENDILLTATLENKGAVYQAEASADTATQASGATPTKAEFDALLAELRDVKTKLRTAGTLAPNTP